MNTVVRNAAADRTIRLRRPDRLYIGGRCVAPAGGGRIEVVSAHSEAVIATVAEAGAEDMDAAVAAVREAEERRSELAAA